jgi:6-pyruvoyltetrahydropterin/6-carboxytetrahydropterin synthase
MSYHYIITKTLSIDAAHSLTLNYESKCSQQHGHQWLIEITCESNTLNENGMIMDFSCIKKQVKDLLDHTNINDKVDFNPTAENLAQWILDMFPLATKVSVQESPGNVATCIYKTE